MSFRQQTTAVLMRLLRMTNGIENDELICSRGISWSDP